MNADHNKSRRLSLERLEERASPTSLSVLDAFNLAINAASHGSRPQDRTGPDRTPRA